MSPTIPVYCSTDCRALVGYWENNEYHETGVHGKDAQDHRVTACSHACLETKKARRQKLEGERQAMIAAAKAAGTWIES